MNPELRKPFNYKNELLNNPFTILSSSSLAADSDKIRGIFWECTVANPFEFACYYLEGLNGINRYVLNCF